MTAVYFNVHEDHEYNENAEVEAVGQLNQVNYESWIKDISLWEGSTKEGSKEL